MAGDAAAGLLGPAPFWKSGSHRPTGFVAGLGPGIPRQAPAGTARVVDLAPTVLDLLGTAVPGHMDGRPLFRSRRMTRLSIIIVSWNTRELLGACLTSIYRHPPPAPFEVIVVDNASGDGSRERVRREFPAVRLIENPANLGFAAASNRGAAAATGSYLLFLNSDTRVHAGTLDGALSFMERHPRAGVMGCLTLDDGGSPQGTALGFPTPPRVFANISGLSRLLRFPRLRRRARRRRADYVQGSFLVIPRRVFDRCGGFDERFFSTARTPTSACGFGMPACRSNTIPPSPSPTWAAAAAASRSGASAISSPAASSCTASIAARGKGTG